MSGTETHRVVALSYVGITIDCNALATESKPEGIELREVGRDTSCRLQHSVNALYTKQQIYQWRTLQ